MSELEQLTVEKVRCSWCKAVQLEDDEENWLLVIANIKVLEDPTMLDFCGRDCCIAYLKDSKTVRD